MKSSDPFLIRCSREVFTDSEIGILEDHGKRFERLTEGCQQPSNEAGRRFVEVVNGNRKAETIYEKTWMKYLWRQEWERNPVNRAAMGTRRRMHDDREDWKRMRSGNYGEVARRVRGLDD